MQPLEAEGCLVLHDVTLPGLLDGLEHVVVGPTGVWVVGSWRRRGRLPGGAAVPAGVLGGLRSQTQAIAAVLNDGWAQLPIQPLLCMHGAWPRTRPTLGGIRVAAARRLAQVVRSGSTVAPGEVERATSRLLKVLRPAA